MNENLVHDSNIGGEGEEERGASQFEGDDALGDQDEDGQEILESTYHASGILHTNNIASDFKISD